MTKDDALEIIFSNPQYRELVDALEDAKKTLSPDERQEVSQALMNDVDKFVAQRLGELSEAEAVKAFRA